MRPWTEPANVDEPGAEIKLQWGHGLAAVDGVERPNNVQSPSPLQWGHGLAAVDGCWPPCSRRARSCFNGATALRPWTGRQPRRIRQPPRRASMGPRPCGRGRSQARARGTVQVWASMGPRPCGRGRLDLEAKRPCGLELQWGHGLAAVDGVRRIYVGVAGQVLQWGHGLAAVDGGKAQ